MPSQRARPSRLRRAGSLLYQSGLPDADSLVANEMASIYLLPQAWQCRQHLDASSAHVIEAMRLADTLAALRERPRPGLDELMEAMRAVFCYDSDTPLQLIERAVLVDEALGEVPDDVPACRWCRTYSRSRSGCAWPCAARPPPS